MQLNDSEIELAKKIEMLNLLLRFPMSDLMIERWAKYLHKVLPELSPENLEIVIDEFLQGELNYDDRIGIANIIRGYRKVFKVRRRPQFTD